jgi:cytochrome c-type biogenesis protein CcmH/NrfG
MQLGRLDETIAALGQYLAVEARNSEARYLLGMALVLKGDHAQAMPILDALVREDASPSAFYARSLANFGLHRKGAALADLDEATSRGLQDGNIREWRSRIAAMP